MRQDQWDWIFSYAFTLALSVAYAALLWWFDATLWLAIPLAHWQGYAWNRAFPRTVQQS